MDLTADSALQRIHNRLLVDLPFYFAKVLKIEEKGGLLIPFKLNHAQLHVHELANRQLSRLRMIRMLVVKGRQQGMSTYINGRGYHKTTMFTGQNALLLSHESETTSRLYRMIKTYYDNTPAPLQPQADTRNQRRFEFAGIRGQYHVGTAGNTDFGRGGTNQILHGSEAAYWENADGLLSGALQTVPRLPGTEVWLESTGNGPKGMFYEYCMEALDGKGEYELIFVPWFWQPEYQADPPSDAPMQLSEEEEHLKATYNLTNPQLYWRRLKISELKSEWLFKQEYPNHVMEAFQFSGTPLIPPEYVAKARKQASFETNPAPVVAGYDPAPSNDRRILVVRQGREVLFWQQVQPHATQDQAKACADAIVKFNVAKLFVDYAYGTGIVDLLHSWGFSRVVEAVHFAKGADDPRFLNKRSEMAYAVRDWMVEPGGAKIPDDDKFAADLLAIPDARTNHLNKIKLPAKEEIKSLLKKSTDIFDSLCLTFAYPVRADISYLQSQPNLFIKSGNGSSPLRTMAHIRNRGGGRNVNRQVGG